MFDNPTDNHTDIEVPQYDKLRFHEAKKISFKFQQINLQAFSCEHFARVGVADQFYQLYISRVPMSILAISLITKFGDQM